MYSKLLKINVFLGSKPMAIISFAFSRVKWLTSETDKFFHRNFSSSVNWITRGTSKTSWNHLEKCDCKIYNNLFIMNGTTCPRCKASDDGPLPVYKKNGFFCSMRKIICSKSLNHSFFQNYPAYLWEKNIWRFSRWCRGLGQTFASLWSKPSSILEQPKRTISLS